MATIRLSKHVIAPLNLTFEVFTNFRKMQARLSSIVRMDLLTDGPTRVGTRFRETRIIFKKEATEELEVRDYIENATISIGCESCGADYDSRYDFHPEDDGTRIEFTMKSKPLTFTAKLMSPLAYLMCRPMMKLIDKDMEELKAVAEAEALQLLQAEQTEQV